MSNRLNDFRAPMSGFLAFAIQREAAVIAHTNPIPPDMIGSTYQTNSHFSPETEQIQSLDDLFKLQSVECKIVRLGGTKRAGTGAISGLGEGDMGVSCPKCLTAAFKIFYDSVGRPVAKCVECGTEMPFTKAAFGAHAVADEPPAKSPVAQHQQKDPHSSD
jgi:Zn ribbon nucleic-acid-binding protein